MVYGLCQGTFHESGCEMRNERELVFGGKGLTLFEKTSEAVRDLKVFERMALETDHENGFYGCEGGGMRTAAVRQLCVLAGVKVTWRYNLCGLEPVEVMDHVRKEYPGTEWWGRAEHFGERALEQTGVMERTGPWCMREFREWGGDAKVKLIPGRWMETRRKHLVWETWPVYEPASAVGVARCTSWIWNPIAGWTEEELWEFVERGSLHVCELYGEGFERMGCIGCPMRGKAALDRDMARWPEVGRFWFAAFARIWDRKVTRKQLPFCSGAKPWPGIDGVHRFEELYEWWRDQAGCGGTDVRCGAGRW